MCNLYSSKVINSQYSLFTQVEELVQITLRIYVCVRGDVVEP